MKFFGHPVQAWEVHHMDILRWIYKGASMSLKGLVPFMPGWFWSREGWELRRYMCRDVYAIIWLHTGSRVIFVLHSYSSIEWWCHWQTLLRCTSTLVRILLLILISMGNMFFWANLSIVESTKTNCFNEDDNYSELPPSWSLTWDRLNSLVLV